MPKYKNSIKYLIDKMIIRYRSYSLEKIFLDSIKNNSELGKKYKNEIELLDKGAPLYRILKLLRSKNSEVYEFLEILSDLQFLNKQVRNKLDKVFNSLFEINNTFQEVVSFFNSLEKKILIMNISLSFIYSLLPWLVQFLYIAKSAQLTKEIAPFLAVPNIINVLYYFILLCTIEACILYIFYRPSKIIKHEIISTCIFLVTQIFLLILIL